MNIKFNEEKTEVLSRLKWATIHRDKPFLPILNENRTPSKKSYIGSIDDQNFSFFIKRTKTIKDIFLPPLFAKGKIKDNIVSMKFMPGLSTILISMIIVVLLADNWKQLMPQYNERFIETFIAYLTIILIFLLLVFAERKMISDRMKKILFK